MTRSLMNTVLIEWLRVKAGQTAHLMYHLHTWAESEAMLIWSSIKRPWKIQLKALKAGYHTLTPGEAYRILKQNEVPKERNWSGWLWWWCRGFLYHRLSKLKKYKMTATNNIITDFTPKGKKMSWPWPNQRDEKDLWKSYSQSSRPSQFQSWDLKEWASRSKRLDKVLDQNTSVIVYPSGRSQVTIDQAKKADYKLGLTTVMDSSSADGPIPSNEFESFQPLQERTSSHDPRIKRGQKPVIR